MNVVVDASVAVKWFILEERHELARRLVEPGVSRCSPDFLQVEVANVLSRKLRGGLISEPHCKTALAVLDGLVSLVPTGRHIERAFDLSMRLHHALYDCIYVAVAEERNATFVTDDEKFGRKCLDAGLAKRVTTLRSLYLA